MSTTGGPGGGEHRLFFDMIARLRQAWENVRDPAQGVDLERLAPPAAAPQRLAYLVGLVKEDMDIRARRSSPVRLDVYLSHFPELASAPQLPLLIFEEYRLRHQFGDCPPLEDYQPRFPEHFDTLVRLAEKPQASTTGAGGTAATAEQATKLTPTDRSSLGRHYRLLRRLGAGTYGEVWLAEAPGGVQVAIKKLYRSLDQAEGRRELHVLEVIKNLHHPCLLSTQAFWVEDGRLCVVLELADGTLRDRFNECRQQGLPGLPPDELLTYVRQAADGLDFLHSHRVQHRDVKPENLMLLKGYLKVGDLGLAREWGGNDQSIASLCGSPFYMAPEVWRHQVSPHSDQYSLAVTYAEMRRGQRPFRASTLQEAMVAHIEAEPDLDPLPIGEQEVLRKALAKETDERFGSCREFVYALAQAAVPTPSLWESVRRPAPPPLPNRRGWLLVAASVATLVIGTVATGWALWSSSKPENNGDDPNGGGKQPELPEGFEKVGDARGEWAGTERYYKTIRRVKDGQSFEFVLVPGYRDRGKGIDLAPFYILRGKVTVAQFRAAARDPAYQRLLKQLEEHHPEEVMQEDGEKRRRSGNWDRPGLNKDEQWPVRDVTVTEAHCFAAWLGCELPAVEQWNQASGFYDWKKRRQVGQGPKQEEGPFERGWVVPEQMTGDNTDVAVGMGRKAPLPVGQARRDRGPYGCTDMAGNGYEWTRTLARAGGDRFPLRHPTGTDEVVVRGRSFSKFAPLRYKDLEEIASQQYFQTRDVYSFRVGLELPDNTEK